MSKETRWWRYVQRRIHDHGWTLAEFLRHAKLPNGTTTRWSDGAQPSNESIRKVARTFGDSVPDALIESEEFTAEELEFERGSRTDLSDIPTARLIAELQRRIPPDGPRRR